MSWPSSRLNLILLSMRLVSIFHYDTILDSHSFSPLKNWLKYRKIQLAGVVSAIVYTMKSLKKYFNIRCRWIACHERVRGQFSVNMQYVYNVISIFNFIFSYRCHYKLSRWNSTLLYIHSCKQKRKKNKEEKNYIKFCNVDFFHFICSSFREN